MKSSNFCGLILFSWKVIDQGHKRLSIPGKLPIAKPCRATLRKWKTSGEQRSTQHLPWLREARIESILQKHWPHWTLFASMYCRLLHLQAPTTVYTFLGAQYYLSLQDDQACRRIKCLKIWSIIEMILIHNTTENITADCASLCNSLTFSLHNFPWWSSAYRSFVLFFRHVWGDLGDFHARASWPESWLGIQEQSTFVKLRCVVPRQGSHDISAFHPYFQQCLRQRLRWIISAESLWIQLTFFATVLRKTCSVLATFVTRLELNDRKLMTHDTILCFSFIVSL